MEEPVFVKCEPAWPSDTEEEPSNFARPLDSQVKIKEDPHAALDEVEETLDEERDNSGDSSAGLVMEEPVFVKCEPAWPSDTEEEPSNFARPLDSQVKIKEDPHAALDEVEETLDEERDNSGDSSAGLHSSVFFNTCDVSDDPLISKTEEVFWDCSSCGKSFEDKGLLKKHVVHNMKHLTSSACCPKDDDCPLLGKGPYHCKKCNRKFSQRKNLNQHMSTHMEHKPYSCSFCSKCFTSKANLKHHILTHSGDRPHVCPRCGLSFARACGLNRHKATHTLSKPFICSTCGKAFRHRRSWQKHAVVHSGEKPFLCEKCGGLFSLMGNLKAHMLKFIC